MKKFKLSIAVTLLIALSATSSFAAPSDSKDVDSDSWCYQCINYVQENNLMYGSNGTFNPNGNLTKADFLTIIGRAYESITSTLISSDASNVTYYSKYVDWALENGLIKDSSYAKLMKNINREEIAVILYRTTETFNIDFTIDKYLLLDCCDLNVSPWAYNEVYFAVEYGFMRFCNQGYFYPQRECTRAEVANILARYHSVAVPQKVIPE